MTSATLTQRPASPIPWADDDEDDFDFESWKASVDTSAPTIEDMGALQLPPAEDDHSFIVTGPRFRKVESTVADGQALEIVEAQQNEEPVDVEAPTQESIDLQCEQAKRALVWRALDERSDAPAYPELSCYHDSSPSYYIRTKYTQHWNQMKADSGLDCRRTVQFRPSRLQQVVFVDEEEIEEIEVDLCCEETQYDEVKLDADIQQMPEGKLETIFEVNDEVDDIALGISSTYEEDDDISDLVEVASISSWEGSDEVVEDVLQDARDAHISDVKAEPRYSTIMESMQSVLASSSPTDFDPDLEFSFDDLFDDRYDARDTDEGYSSASSSTSPTTSQGNEVPDKKLPSFSAAPALWTDSALLSSLRRASLPPTTPCLERLPSPDLKHIKQNPTYSDYISGVVGTGWYLLSSVPWTTVGIVTTAVVIGGITALVRRR